MFVTQPFLHVCYALDIRHLWCYELCTVAVHFHTVETCVSKPQKSHFHLYCFPRKEPINIQTIFILFLLLCNIVICSSGSNSRSYRNLRETRISKYLFLLSFRAFLRTTLTQSTLIEVKVTHIQKEQFIFWYSMPGVYMLFLDENRYLSTCFAHRGIISKLVLTSFVFIKVFDNICIIV